MLGYILDFEIYAIIKFAKKGSENTFRFNGECNQEFPL